MYKIVIKKILFIFMGFFLVAIFGCETNKNPIASNFSTDTTDGHWWDGDSIIVRKPNIYIYPVQKMNLSIKLVFPQGGSITESIPLYEDTWDIEVEPSGLIDDQYTYLFYECRIADRFKYESGWEVEGYQLENFFRNNLSQTCFNDTEIEDFIEYWIPRLDSSDTYLIYPQYSNDIEPLIDLQFSEQPESLLQLLYIIDTCKTENSLTLSEPVIPEFKRQRFTVTEWGVILK